MATAVRHPSRRSLWLAIVAAPLAWAAQEWVVWYVASAPCEPYSRLHALDGRASWIYVAVHVLALAVAALALAVGIRGWRREHTMDGDAPVEAFLATVAIVISAIGLAALIWGSLGTFLLHPCVVVR
jgi:hypothetical protein